MLSTLKIERRSEDVVMVSVDEAPQLADGIEALIREGEGITVVASIAEAERRGWHAEFRAAWLTVAVHSSLEAVGLTAAMSEALTECNIACNVIAGYFHDRWS